MPGTHHEESHFTASAAVRDVVIGMADGLTVPFALAAGISGAVAASANAAKLAKLCPQGCEEREDLDQAIGAAQPKSR